MGFLTVVRHGQASFGEDQYDKLSDLGERQSRVLGEWWARKGMTFERVYTGPLDRQRRTAEIAGEALREAGHHWPEVNVIDELAELPVDELAKKYIPMLMAEDPNLAQLIMKFQEAEGLEKEAVFQEAFEIVVDHWMEGRFDDSGLETWDSFVERVEQGLSRITEESGDGTRVVVFTSGGPTALAARYALDASTKAAIDLAWTVRNGSFSEFTYANGRLTLQSFNSIPHFEDDELVTHR